MAGTVPDSDEDTDRVVVVPMWECRQCDELVERGKPCPKCGRLLLED